MNETILEVAKIGRTVGLQGDLKLHFLSDFPEQFKKGAKFQTKKRGVLEVEAFNQSRLLVRFKDFNTPELAQKLVNTVLLTTVEQSRENCNLQKDEFFWFDIVGCEVVEDELVLGVVDEIERISKQDYLVIKTDSKLTDQKLPKSFLIPYIDRFIGNVEIDKKTIYVKRSLEILKAS